MSIFACLDERFAGSAIDDPITEEDIQRFEAKWNRSIPPALREFLLEVNGVLFDASVAHRKVPIHVFASLGGIDSLLRSYGDFALPFLLPFASSLTHGAFCIDTRENRSPVYLIDSLTSATPGRLCLKHISPNLERFVEELEMLS